MTQIQTFQRPEESRIREGPHSLGVASLDSEVVHSVQVEIHDLVCEPITADGLHNPVINGSVLVQSIEQDVSWGNTTSQLALHQILMCFFYKIQVKFRFLKNLAFLLKSRDVRHSVYFALSKVTKPHIHLFLEQNHNYNIHCKKYRFSKHKNR